MVKINSRDSPGEIATSSVSGPDSSVGDNRGATCRFKLRIVTDDLLSHTLCDLENLLSCPSKQHSQDNNLTWVSARSLGKVQ